MHRNYFSYIVALAICSLLVILFFYWDRSHVPTRTQSVIQPPKAPFHTYISGIGIIEPQTGNIYIGTPLNRIVSKIFVKVNDKVKKGDILFVLDNSDLKSELQIKRMAYKSALARLQKLQALPQKEDLASAHASYNDAKADFDNAKSQFEMVKALPDVRSISMQESNLRRFKYEQADAKLKEAQANLDKIKAGAWKPDLEIAKYEALQAKAAMEAVENEIDRSIVKSPVDGTILQIKIHEGEFASQNPQAPLMIIGNVDELRLRVSINQLDVPFFKQDEPAVAYLEGDSKKKFDLEFLRIEPLLSAKQELSNEVKERVDTRVFDIIYKIKNEGNRIFPGGRMDVFISTENNR